MVRRYLALAACLAQPLAAQTHLSSVPIKPYQIRLPADHLLSKAIHRDLKLADQSKFRLYGDNGFLATILQLNPHIQQLDAVGAGTALIIPIPEELVRDLPEYWQALSPADAGEWRLIDCCDEVMTGRFKAAGKDNEDWARSVATANGVNGDPLAALERKWLMVPVEMPDALRAGHDNSAPTVIPGEQPVRRSLGEGGRVPTVIPSERSERRGSPPLTAAQQQVINAPEQHDLAALTELPPAALEQLERENPDALADKLTVESIETLDEQAIDKIPAKTIENKAWTFSFLDTFKPGMAKFFKDMKTSAAGAYVGTRIGFSLISPEEKLLSQVQVVGLLAEVRQGIFRGLRLNWDYVPDVTARIDGKEQSIAWNRVLFGWSFELPLTSQIAAHITPQIGSYSVEASLPPANVPTEQQAPQTFSQSNALSGGIYLDVEYQAFFYILRLWASSDRGVPALTQDEEAVTSRFGFDGFLKGAGLRMGGHSIAPSYLVFTSLDYLSLRGKSETGQSFDLQFFIPYLGTGISLSW